MKDFFDIWYLARTFEFDEATLGAAIRATFARRQTPLPHETPVALTTVFSDDPSKAAQWRAFIGRSRAVGTAPGLGEIVHVLVALLEPILMSDGEGPVSPRTWLPGTGRWQQNEGVDALSLLEIEALARSLVSAKRSVLDAALLAGGAMDDVSWVHYSE
jgi:hypothetical protein